MPPQTEIILTIHVDEDLVSSFGAVSCDILCKIVDLLEHQSGFKNVELVDIQFSAQEEDNNTE